VRPVSTPWRPTGSGVRTPAQTTQFIVVFVHVRNSMNLLAQEAVLFQYILRADVDGSILPDLPKVITDLLQFVEINLVFFSADAHGGICVYFNGLDVDKVGIFEGALLTMEAKPRGNLEGYNSLQGSAVTRLGVPMHKRINQTKDYP